MSPTISPPQEPVEEWDQKAAVVKSNLLQEEHIIPSLNTFPPEKNKQVEH